MKQQTQRSLLKWASLLCNKQLSSIIQIQNTSILIKLLNILQPLTFQQLYQLDQRSSNSVINILKAIDRYFKKQLRCNVSTMIDNLNIYKTPIVVWQLLIGVAIKGKNRDNNIKLILKMQLSQQSELMLLVQDVIEKFTKFETKPQQTSNSLKDSISSSSDYSQSNSNNHHRRKQSKQSDQFINQLVEENDGLKQRVFELQNQLSQLKASQERVKKSYEDRINQMKTERYMFVEVLAGGAESRVNRARGGSQFRFRDSLVSSSELRVFDDPLGDLGVSITGTLPQIANDMLNAIRNLKKQLAMQQQKSTALQDHIKDIKLSFTPLIQQNKLLKSQLQKFLTLQNQLHTLKQQNQQHINNETEMIKIISQYEQQKCYLREMVEKLKVEKNQLMVELIEKKNNSDDEKKKMREGVGKSGWQGDADVGRKSTSQKIDIFRAPSIILRQMNSQLDLQPSPLNQQIDSIKQPLIQQKYELKVLQLRQKNNILKMENNELVKVNKLLENAVHQSVQKSEQILKNIEQGYNALFERVEGSPCKTVDLLNGNNSRVQKKQPSSPIQIIISQNSNEWNDDVDEGMKHSPTKVIVDSNKSNSNSKIVDFYQQVKKIIQSYEQKQLLLLIQIESLKKQLADLMLQKEKQQIQMKSQQQQESLNKADKKRKSKKRVSFKIQQQNQDDEEEVSYRVSIQDETILGEDEKYQQQKNLVNPVEEQGNDRQELLRTVTGKQIAVQKNHQQEQLQELTLFNEISPPPPTSSQPATTPVMQKSTEIYPPVEFLQIQQGEQFNQNQLPVRKSSDDMEDKFNNEDEGEKSELIIEEGDDKVGGLKGSMKKDGIKENEEKNKTNSNIVNLSQLSAITISSRSSYRPTHPNRSYFAKSGFYNQSFLQLSNKLQSQIQLDMAQITQDLNKPRRNTITWRNQRIQQQDQGEQSRVGSLLKSSIKSRNRWKNVQVSSSGMDDDEQQRDYEKQHEQLVGKLERIKESYERVKNFHLKSTQQMQTQLKSQLHIEEAELTKLKVVNQQLKQQLTKMIAEKKAIKQKLHQMKLLLKTHLLSNPQHHTQPQPLPTHLTTLLNDITQLQHILPQLQLTLQQSKLNELQTLYQQQQLRNKHLNEEIQVLLETVVYFRNLTVE